MSLIFEPEQHVYTLDGARVPSVTQTLLAAGLIDFSKIPSAILTAAKARGTAVHRAAHFWLEHDLDLAEFRSLFPDYAGYLDSLIALFESGRLRTVCCERRVWSRRYGFAGTLDWLGQLDGQGALLDWATGAPKDVAKDLQTSAYEAAARETAAEDQVLADFFAVHPRVQRVAVRLMKDGRLPKLEPYSDPRHFQEFRTLLVAQQIVERRRGSWINVEAA